MTERAKPPWQCPLGGWANYEGISISHLALLSDPVVRHHRPLPDIPTSEDDAAGGSSLLLPAPSFGGGLDSSMRWSSRENLLTAATDEDPQLFVALYDFQAGGENQLSLKKGRSRCWILH